VVLKNEEHAGGMPRHSRHERSAGLKETLKLCGFPGESGIADVFIIYLFKAQKSRPHARLTPMRSTPAHFL
jgi:hypothetical protein